MLYSVNSPILRGCLVMADISGEDRSQVLLLPDSVEDYVGPDNPVRFIDAFFLPLTLYHPASIQWPVAPRARRCIRKPHRQSHQSGSGWI